MAAIFILICFGMVFSIVLWSLRMGIAPMPTTQKAKRALLSLLPPECEGVVYELGSGWGNLAWALAKRYPKAQIRAYEMSPIPYFFAKLCFSAPNLHYFRRDFRDISLKNADLIVCYLYPGAMQQLKVKFEQELKPGTFIASNTFAIPGWKPEKAVKLDDLYRTPIYLYIRTL